MSDPVRVAIFGSCCTRDVFNRRFCPTYKESFDCVLLANQVSLISLMSPPVVLPLDADLTGMDAAAEGEFRAEASRQYLDELVREQPAYLLIDLFGDVHFGSAELTDGTITRNRWKITKTPYYAGSHVRDLPSGGKGDLTQWRNAADAFLAFVRENCPDTKVLVHFARNTGLSREADGTLRVIGNPDATARMNRLWSKMDAYLVNRPGVRAIDLWTDDIVSFDDHPWGPFAVHYELDYHQEFLDRLKAIVAHDATHTPRLWERLAPTVYAWLPPRIRRSSRLRRLFELA